MKYPGKRILCDVDGVLLDFASMAVGWVNNNVRLPGQQALASVADIHMWDILEALGCPSQQADFDWYVNRCQPGRYLDLYPGAAEFLNHLRALAEVVIVTSPFKKARGWEQDRRNILERRFGVLPKDIVFTSRKELVRGDVLIDDGPHNINDFPGPVVVIDRPWNRDIAPSTFLRYRCLDYTASLKAVDHILRYY